MKSNGKNMSENFYSLKYKLCGSNSKKVIHSNTLPSKFRIYYSNKKGRRTTTTSVPLKNQKFDKINIVLGQKKGMKMQFFFPMYTF